MKMNMIKNIINNFVDYTTKMKSPLLGLFIFLSALLIISHSILIALLLILGSIKGQTFTLLHMLYGDYNFLLFCLLFYIAGFIGYKLSRK